MLQNLRTIVDLIAMTRRGTDEPLAILHSPAERAGPGHKNPARSSGNQNGPKTKLGSLGVLSVQKGCNVISELDKTTMILYLIH